MKELNGPELREFISKASPEEIIKYWKEILAPKYGYKRLVNPNSGEIIAEIGSV